MNIRQELLKEHSRKQTDKIAAYIGNDPQKFEELMKLFFGNIYRITQRAAWAVSACTDNYPELINPYLERMIHNLDKEVHDAVKRNTMRIMQDINIPDELLGNAADIAFRLLAKKDEPIAVKVFAMSVAYNISLKEPDLQHELKLLIEEQIPYTTPAFISRGSKILRKLK